MSFTVEQLKAVLKRVHNPKLAKEAGMVYQIWEDGEITLQKAGDLLWQRTLHSTQPGLYDIRIPPSWMPVQYNKGEHGYAFVTGEDAEIVRDMLQNTENLPKYTPPPKPVDDGPLEVATFDDPATAELVLDYLVKEFPMARDGQLVVAQVERTYSKGTPYFQVQFPSGHDHWIGFKNTYEKLKSASTDYVNGYRLGYKQGQRDADHQRYLEMSAKEQTALRMRPANPGDILEELGRRKTFDMQADTKEVRKTLTKKNIQITDKQIRETVREHADRGWIRIIE